MNIKQLNERLEKVLKEDNNIVEPYIVQALDLSKKDDNVIFQNEYINLKDALIDFIKSLNKNNGYYIEIVNHDSNDILICSDDIK